MSIMKFPETEKPRRAAAVRNTLATVTPEVPNRRVSLLEKRLDTMVPREMMVERIPIKETGTPSSRCITGHPEPSKESGSPRLTKARYTRHSKRVYMDTLLLFHFPSIYPNPTGLSIGWGRKIHKFRWKNFPRGL